MTYEQLLLDAAARMEQAGLEGGLREPRILLLHLNGWSSSDLLSRGTDDVPTDLAAQFGLLVDRRLKGEPVFRIIGEREFHSLPFQLSQGTLEPRDDTEALISLVLDAVVEPKAESSFVDLGTGTGIIAISLLSELPNAKCVAVDLSKDAIKTAEKNAVRNQVQNRFSTAEGKWFSPLNGTFDFIVSNPPYIETKVMDELSSEVRNYDPSLALDGGADGLDAYRDILASGQEYLKPDGFLALEIGHDQRVSVTTLAEQNGWRFGEAMSDLGGNDRALLFYPNGKP